MRLSLLFLFLAAPLAGGLGCSLGPRDGSASGASAKPLAASPMVLIPAGDFTMGSNYDEYDESPERSVYLKPYFIDTYEVSNEDYRACMKARACTPSDLSDDRVLGANLHPVVGINANDAAAYCAFAGKRLPTEAEWEKAARGSSGNKYPWGNSSADGKANLDGEQDGFAKTAPVNSFSAGQSVYGVLNLGGNVAEWVADSYDPVFYKVAPRENPLGSGSGDMHSYRGGSYRDPLFGLRTPNRSAQKATFRSDIIGIRCAKSVK